MCRADEGYESPPVLRITLAPRSLTRHPLIVTCRVDPGGPYEEERQSFDPGFLAKASKLAHGAVESAAADARSRGTAVADRQAALDVIEIGSPRLIAPRRRWFDSESDIERARGDLTRRPRSARHEHLRREAARQASGAARSRIVSLAPPPGVLSAHTVPPNSCTKRWTRARPRPVPVPIAFVV
jgi:hypothetical protein